MPADTRPGDPDFDALSRDAFVERFAAVFEHSPWIAERSYARRPFTDADALFDAMTAVIRDASHDERLALLRAHPQLAGKVARAGTLTEHSTSEQSAPGCST